MAARDVDRTDILDVFADGQVGNARHQDAGGVARKKPRHCRDDVAAERERLEAIRAMVREGEQVIAPRCYAAVRGPADAQALPDRLIRRGRARARAAAT